MKDFLLRLAERALGRAPTVRPLIPSFHAPILLVNQGVESAHPAEGEVMPEGTHLPVEAARRGGFDGREESAARDAIEDRAASSNSPAATFPGVVPLILTAAHRRKEGVRKSEVKSQEELPRLGAMASDTPTALPPPTAVAPAGTAVARGESVGPGSEPDARPLSVLVRVQTQTSAGEEARSSISPPRSREPFEMSPPIEGTHSAPVPLARPSVDPVHARERRSHDESSQRSDLAPPEQGGSATQILRAPVQVRLAGPDAEEREAGLAAHLNSDVKRDDSAPAIHITIGRIEVRAVPPALPARRPAHRAAPKLSLDDYLKRRGGRVE